MRITLVIHSLYSGGAERVMSTMANYWAEKGWQVTLLTFSGDNLPFYDLHEAITYRPLNISQDSVHILDFLRNNWTRLQVLRSAIAQTKPDVVISFMTTTNILVILATLGLKFPVIVSERNNPELFNPGFFWTLLRRWSYNFADRIIVQTQRATEYFPRSMQSRISQIPNPVLIPPPHPLGSEAKLLKLPSRSIVAVGRLEPQKGFDLLLSAFSTLTEEFPEWTLTILGEGDLRSTLVAQCEVLNISDRVNLPGRVKNVYAFLKSADLFVMSSRFEGFPNTLCEAMASGLAVISTDCPQGPREIIREGLDGLLVPHENIPALAAAMELLMSDDDKRQNLGIYATEIVERFSLETVMGLWETASQEVIKNVTVHARPPKTIMFKTH
jgi:GalNAc-alpha-(1->4)-GalNAc-alpha-(1->3)-diNAcBac-PP-undecaprenol alpha-1,4-N-acetyl-D-galactosaminyltransferase